MNSREKGKRGERQWRDELRANGYMARRGQQFSGSPDSPDVVCEDLPWAHFEVKLVERLDIHAAMEQARRDSGGRAAFVAHRRNFWPWLVTMDAVRLYRLLALDVTGKWAEAVAGVPPSAVLAGMPWARCVVREGCRLNIHEAIGEAKAAAGWRVAFVTHRRPGGAWLVTMEADTFFEFLRGALPPEGTGAERQEISKENTQER
jgi:hypothetical protein